MVKEEKENSREDVGEGELIGEVYGKEVWLSPKVLEQLKQEGITGSKLKKFKHDLIDKLTKRKFLRE